MKILGINWGVDSVFENPHGIPPNRGHDTAAFLVIDGELVAAGEEERFDRIKHSNKIPRGAIAHCLDTAGIAGSDLDAIAYVGDERFIDMIFRVGMLKAPSLPGPSSVRALAHAQLQAQFGEPFADERLVFVPHHLAHAASAAFPSGFEESLVLTLDGQGDAFSGMALSHQASTLTPLRALSPAQSLGGLYVGVIEVLGYRYFDEYKVMGLAPYGDASRFERLFQESYALLDDGEYRLDLPKLVRALMAIDGLPRRRGDPFTELHQDVAAALQAALEAIVFHLARHFRDATGARRLTYAGGVALNCTANGKLLASGLFEGMFVQPLAHDAGCALGAALYVEHAGRSDGPVRRPLRHLFHGRDLGDEAKLEKTLGGWGGVFTVERCRDAPARAAERIAGGEVVAWVQGRSEIGPRALGHRSILADPRPYENRERVNRAVKKREAYRPFAPSVLEERAHEIFEIPPAARLDDLAFMIQIVSVKVEHRDVLRAVTHVDGTARPQTVSKTRDPDFHALIEAFGKSTGVPVVLNTSLNNDKEPIADDADDALACLATTEIDALFLGPFEVRKKTAPAYDALFVERLPHIILVHRRADPDGRSAFELRSNHDPAIVLAIGEPLFRALARADGRTTFADLAEGRSEIAEELMRLWSERVVRLTADR